VSQSDSLDFSAAPVNTDQDVCRNTHWSGNAG
jgi:hypothetical protein